MNAREIEYIFVNSFSYRNKIGLLANDSNRSAATTLAVL